MSNAPSTPHQRSINAQIGAGFYNGTFMRLTTKNITRADLWALAALVSIQYGMAMDEPAPLTPKSLSLDSFKWGRKDW